LFSSFKHGDISASGANEIIIPNPHIEKGKASDGRAAAFSGVRFLIGSIA
jgi:hypothetical protein